MRFNLGERVAAYSYTHGRVTGKIVIYDKRKTSYSVLLDKKWHEILEDWTIHQRYYHEKQIRRLKIERKNDFKENT